MKKIVLIALSAVICLSMFGCGKASPTELTTVTQEGKRTTVNDDEGYAVVQEVLPFKYSKEEDTFKDNEKAHLDGFKVTEDKSDGAVKTKSDAIKIAQKEINVKYNKIKIYFDRTRGIWKVVFSTDYSTTSKDGESVAENKIGQTVYVDEDGYTLVVIDA